MRFVKMHGCRNAYVFVDGRCEDIESPSALAVSVADSEQGIGSDGLIAVQPAELADVRMEMYNADGSRGATCGNGLRCLARYVLDADPTIGSWIVESMAVDRLRRELSSAVTGEPREGGMPRRVYDVLDRAIDAFELASSPALGVRRLVVQTDAGVGNVWALWTSQGAEVLTVDLGIPRVVRADVPGGDGPVPVVAQRIESGGATYSVVCVDTGNHHVVVFVESLEDVNLLVEGPLLERATAFSDRANVHFVKVVSRDILRVRHWERGSGVTLACGSGACAAVVAAVHTGQTEASCRVELPGGGVRVDLGETVLLTGRAEYVCRGEWRDGRVVYD